MKHVTYLRFVPFTAEYFGVEFDEPAWTECDICGNEITPYRVTATRGVEGELVFICDGCIKALKVGGANCFRRRGLRYARQIRQHAEHIKAFVNSIDDDCHIGIVEHDNRHPF